MPNKQTPIRGGNNSNGSRRDKRTRVAAHVHAETIPAAMRPGLTLLDALLNSSALFGEKPVYRVCIAVNPSINALKKRPMPEFAHAQ